MAQSNLCLATVSASISVHATLKSSTPCPPPTCEPCLPSPLMRTTSASLASASASPPADKESSELVNLMMETLRSRASKAATAAAPNANPQSPSPTSVGLDFNKRVETAFSSSTDLIAQAQLAAPKIAPAELTAEEQAEAQRESDWNSSYQKKEEAIACALARTQSLFHGQELAALHHDAETGNLTVPDCDDLFTWSSNAGVDAKTECTGVSVHNLIAKFSS